MRRNSNGEPPKDGPKGKNNHETRASYLPSHATHSPGRPYKPKKKRKCEAKTELCSGELIAKYGVNGSEKEGKTFYICGVCAALIKRGGSKLKSV